MVEIRNPIKKTSIATKERLVRKGFELICQRGYHNVTSVDIAKYAGVATGSLYQYFPDKRAIFLAGTKKYSDQILAPILDAFLQERPQKRDLPKLIERVIDDFIENHTLNQRAHAEIIAMSQLDADFADIFKQNELNLTDQIVKFLSSYQINAPYLRERTHLALGVVDQFCHEVVYHQHPDFDYPAMKAVVAATVSHLIFSN